MSHYVVVDTIDGNRFYLWQNDSKTFMAYSRICDAIQKFCIAKKFLIKSLPPWQMLQKDGTSNCSGLVEVLQCSTASLLNRPPTVLPDESSTLKGLTKLTNPGDVILQVSYIYGQLWTLFWHVEVATGEIKKEIATFLLEQEQNQINILFLISPRILYHLSHNSFLFPELSSP